MDRRALIRGLIGACAAARTFVASAQDTTRVRRIGTLSLGAPHSLDDVHAALGKLGWIEGRNMSFEQRHANQRIEALPALAEELVRLKVELILTAGTPSTLAARRATSTIPIVFWSAADPVGSGLVASLAKPGGNVTGYATAGPEVDAKRLQVLRDLLPSVQRVGVLETSANPYYRATRESLQHAARALRMELIFVEVSAADQIANAVAEIARRGGQAMLLGADDLFIDHQVELMQAVLKHSLPTTVARVHIRQLGALVSYSPTDADHDARAAAFVDRILRGASPADLPVEQPSRFALTINLGTAKALGIVIPKPLLLRADELIR